MINKISRIVLSIVLASLALLVVVTFVAQAAQSQVGVQAALDTAFTYQGELKKDGQPITDTCSMAFRLYEQETGGNQVGSAITSTVSVTVSLFTVNLDFGSDAFAGDARWLGIEIKCTGDGSYVALGRRELTAAPYALHARSAGALQGQPITTTAPITAGQVLAWDGSAWGPAIASGANLLAASGDLTGTYPVLTVTGLYGQPITTTAPATNEVLKWDGSSWSPAPNGHNYQNVIVVAKSGGDYTSIQTAINSISDASANNPYLVWIAPGVYTETVTMKPYVHLQGAGQEATIVTSAASSSMPPTQATLVLTRYVSLRDLTVGNSGTGERNVALLTSPGTTQTLVADVTARAQGSGTHYFALFLLRGGASVKLRGGFFIARGGGGQCFTIYTETLSELDAEGITVLAENCDLDNHGLRTQGSVTLRGGSFTGRGGATTLGIYSDNFSTMEAESVTALGENGSNYSIGLLNGPNAVTTLRGGSFIGREGITASGIDNGGDLAPMLKVEHITALGENGSSNYGIRNTNSGNSATAWVTQSILEGTTNSIIHSGGVITVSNSRLVGGATSGTVTCVGVSRGATFNISTCP